MYVCNTVYFLYPYGESDVRGTTTKEQTFKSNHNKSVVKNSICGFVFFNLFVVLLCFVKPVS